MLACRGEVLGKHRVSDAPFAVRPAVGSDTESVVPMETIFAMYSVECVYLLPAEDVLFRLVRIDQPDARIFEGRVVKYPSKYL